MPGKDEEAELLMKSAKAHHTKTFTKWSADWDDAATDYEKAAQIYTNLNNLQKAKEAWEMASLAHEKAKNPFFAARAIDALANLFRDNEHFMNTPEGAAEVSKLYCRAATMYALDQKPERQAEALAKAARLAPASDAASAAKLILQGLDALEDAGKHHVTLDLYRSLVLLQVRGSLLLDAIATLKRETKTFEKLNQPASGAKAGLEIVVLALQTGDWVLADREYRAMQNNNSYGFLHSKEQGCASSILSAIEERDEAALKEAQKDSALQFITAEIARLAKKLTVNISNVPKKVAKASPLGGGGAASSKAQQPEEEDEEDFK